jgi:N-acetylmuramoyl-L-alanine amidase
MRNHSGRIPLAPLFVMLFLILICGGWFGLHIRGGKARHHKPTPPPQVVVCIDPGHPSESNSARTVQNGTTELRMNWEVALKLRDVLGKDKRIKPILTRSSMNQFMRNRKRALIANDAHAAIAIHLHCDTGGSNGFTIYYPDRIGGSEGLYGPVSSVIRGSHEAALALHTGMLRTLHGSLKDRGIKGDSRTRIGRMIGGLTVGIWSKVPCLTVEMVFLSNSHDAAFIKSKAGQEKMAEALAAGIKGFIKPQLDDYDKMLRSR